MVNVYVRKLRNEHPDYQIVDADEEIDKDVLERSFVLIFSEENDIKLSEYNAVVHAFPEDVDVPLDKVSRRFEKIRYPKAKVETLNYGIKNLKNLSELVELLRKALNVNPRLTNSIEVHISKKWIEAKYNVVIKE